MAKRRSDGGKKTIGYRAFSRILTDAQNPGGIQHCQDGNAYISEYGHPHGGQPAGSQYQHDCFNTQCKNDIEFGDGYGPLCQFLLPVAGR